jgi:hypothetical protein
LGSWFLVFRNQENKEKKPWKEQKPQKTNFQIITDKYSSGIYLSLHLTLEHHITPACAP